MRSHVAAIIALVLPVAAVAQVPDSLPDGVTPEMIQEGAQLFNGLGICMACHGPDAKGTAIGPDLTDDEWLHIDGSFEAIVSQILAGVLADQSKSGQVMPPKGGSSLTDEQVRAVAAYVWSRRFASDS